MIYQIEPKSIVHEVVDEEVVIINFVNGRYYSLVRASAFIWEILSSGPMAKKDLILALVQTYSVEQETAMKDLENFLGELVSEGLIKVVDLEPISYGSLGKEGVDRKPYLSLELEIHTDMAEVIMLDPVHELEYMEGQE